jgi:hypothetical protein
MGRANDEAPKKPGLADKDGIKFKLQLPAANRRFATASSGGRGRRNGHEDWRDNGSLRDSSPISRRRARSKKVTYTRSPTPSPSPPPPPPRRVKRVERRRTPAAAAVPAREVVVREISKLQVDSTWSCSHHQQVFFIYRNK